VTASGGLHNAAAARAADGWRELRAFFTEGAAHLGGAIAAFEDAERALRSAGGAAHADAGFDAVLIGLSIALRLRRRPEDARRAVVLVQELLNVARRRSGEAAAVPLRAYLEDAYVDLAAVLEGGEAARAAEEGIEACDRTLALVRRFHADGAAAHARAAKSLLLRRLAGIRAEAPRPAGAPDTEGRTLLRDADRLAPAAIAAWPAGDADGLAAFLAETAFALAAPPKPARAALDRAETLLRQAQRAAPTGNRYLAARLARAAARAALAADRPDALDAIAGAAAAFRALGLDRDAAEVEAWL
jgi:hypothetical protein